MRKRPSELHFSQDSISCAFRNGTSISKTFRELANGSLSPDDIEPIQIKVYKEKLIVFEGNRRLLLYKILESLDLITYVPVDKFNGNKEYTAIVGK